MNILQRLLVKCGRERDYVLYNQFPSLGKKYKKFLVRWHEGTPWIINVSDEYIELELYDPNWKPMTPNIKRWRECAERLAPQEESELYISTTTNQTQLSSHGNLQILPRAFGVAEPAPPYQDPWPDPWLATRKDKNDKS